MFIQLFILLTIIKIFVLESSSGKIFVDDILKEVKLNNGTSLTYSGTSELLDYNCYHTISSFNAKQGDIIRIKIKNKEDSGGIVGYFMIGSLKVLINKNHYETFCRQDYSTLSSIYTVYKNLFGIETGRETIIGNTVTGECYYYVRIPIVIILDATIENEVNLQNYLSSFTNIYVATTNTENGNFASTRKTFTIVNASNPIYKITPSTNTSFFREYWINCTSDYSCAKYGYFLFMVRELGRKVSINSTCETGYELVYSSGCDSGYLNSSTKCKQCSKNCSTCEDTYTKCTACSSNHYPYYLNGELICYGETNPPPENVYLDSTNNYQDCDTSCKSCSGNPDYCTGCDSNQELNVSDHKCYNKSSTDCTPFCQICNEDQTCQKCLEGYYFIDNGSSLCINENETIEHFYLNKEDEMFKECDSSCINCQGTSTNCTESQDNNNCTPFCQKCNSTDQACQKCLEGYYFIDNGSSICINENETIEHFYLNKEDEMFKECDSSCINCQGTSTNCTESTNSRIQCLEGCKKCEGSPLTCTECYDGYYLSEENNTQCIACDESCLSCSTILSKFEHNCNKCKDGYVMHKFKIGYCFNPSEYSEDNKDSKDGEKFYYDNITRNIHIISDDKCPNDYPILVEEANECMIQNGILYNECEKLLIEKYNNIKINQKEDSNHSSLSKNIYYEYYYEDNSELKEIDTTFICENESFIIESPIGTLYDVDYFQIEDFLNRGINVSDKSASYFTDECGHYSSNGKDLTINYRRKSYVDIEICPSNCQLLLFDYQNNIIQCQCHYGNTDSSLNNLASEINFKFKKSNFYLYKCFGTFFKKALSSYGFWPSLILLIAIIVVFPLYYNKMKKIINLDNLISENSDLTIIMNIWRNKVKKDAKWYNNNPPIKRGSISVNTTNALSITANVNNQMLPSKDFNINTITNTNINNKLDSPQIPWYSNLLSYDIALNLLENRPFMKLFLHYLLEKEIILSLFFNKNNNFFPFCLRFIVILTNLDLSIYFNCICFGMKSIDKLINKSDFSFTVILVSCSFCLITGRFIQLLIFQKRRLYYLLNAVDLKSKYAFNYNVRIYRLNMIMLASILVIIFINNLYFSTIFCSIYFYTQKFILLHLIVGIAFFVGFEGILILIGSAFIYSGVNIKQK